VTASFAKVPKCKVPKLVGLTLKKARTRLLRAHCRLGKVTRKVSSLKKKGRVLSQRPKPGKSLRSGSKVNVTVGRGRRSRGYLAPSDHSGPASCSRPNPAR